MDSDGPKFYHMNELTEKLEYKSTPSVEMYLVYKFSKEVEKEFKGKEWILPVSPYNYERPFTITLYDLLRLKSH